MIFAFRQLRKSPGFTLAAIATLALCLGANLVIFSAVNAILLRPLPFPEPERLVHLANAYPGANVERSAASIANYFERRGQIPALASIANIQEWSVIVGDPGSPQRVQVARVMPEFFGTLGVKLAMGRSFTDAELTYQTDQVAVLTDGFWRSHFQADPNVLGKTFLNDGLTIRVIGVLPPGFRYLSSRAQFFRPFSHELREREAGGRHSNNGNMIGRLAPGASIAAAQAQLDALNAALLETDPNREQIAQARFRTTIFPLHADHVREVRPTLLLLQGGALLLLVIGAVNLANLFLIRANARAKEVAVRQALGATTAHLARDAIAETLLLAGAGIMFGLAIGAGGVALLSRFGAEQLPLGATIALDATTVAVGIGAALVIALLLAGPVVWFNRGHRLAHGLQLESRGGTASRAAQRVRHSFIVAQVALAFVLLAGAALLGLSLQRALNTPTGFESSHLLTGRITLPWKNYQDGAARLAFIERLVPAIRALPGVEHVAVAYDPPFTESGSNGAVRVEGYEETPGEKLTPHYFTTATAEYWAAMRIPLLRGRLLEDADNHRSERVCVVDRKFAERYWPGGDAIGRRIANGFDLSEDRLMTIVGVVASVKQERLEEDLGYGTIYFPYRLFEANNFSLIVRTVLPPEALAATVRKTVSALDPGLPLDDVKSMDARIAESLVGRRSPAVLAGVFAGAALLLAAVGLYGVLAYAVAQRTRELGIRVALGAQRRDVMRMIFGQGARLTAIGVLLGIAGAWALGNAVSSLLYQVPAHDPVALTGVATMLGLVAAIACLLPALRATKVDPMIALRAEELTPWPSRSRQPEARALHDPPKTGLRNRHRAISTAADLCRRATPAAIQAADAPSFSPASRAVASAPSAQVAHETRTPGRCPRKSTSPSEPALGQVSIGAMEIRRRIFPPRVHLAHQRGHSGAPLRKRGIELRAQKVGELPLFLGGELLRFLFKLGQRHAAKLLALPLESTHASRPRHPSGRTLHGRSLSRESDVAERWSVAAGVTRHRPTHPFTIRPPFGCSTWPVM